jgi:hypothetical protein
VPEVLTSSELDGLQKAGALVRRRDRPPPSRPDPSPVNPAPPPPLLPDLGPVTRALEEGFQQVRAPRLLRVEIVFALSSRGQVVGATMTPVYHDETP